MGRAVDPISGNVGRDRALCSASSVAVSALWRGISFIRASGAGGIAINRGSSGKTITTPARTGISKTAALAARAVCIKRS